MNSFVSLAQQGFFDATPCHRLTDSADLAVLQCGDPTGRGSGGRLSIRQRVPHQSVPAVDPALKRSVPTRGARWRWRTRGPDTNGSQFFIVYRDSLLPPTYTAFGTVDETGLAVVDRIAKAGVKAGSSTPDDGAPRMPVTVESVRAD